jgi:hypothetical protein
MILMFRMYEVEFQLRSIDEEVGSVVSLRVPIKTDFPYDIELNLNEGKEEIIGFAHMELNSVGIYIDEKLLKNVDVVEI